LRWKQGEYQALFRLKKTTKDHLTPLIEVAEIGWDFETKTFKNTIDDHLAPVAKRIQEKWGRGCFVDLNLINPTERLSDGKHPVEFVFDDLRTKKCGGGVTVAGLECNDDYNCAVSQVHSKDNNGICLRLKIEQAAKPKIENSINDFLNKMGIEQKECDVVLDLGSPNYIPIEGFSKLVQMIVQKLPYLNDWRTFSVIGGSFPPSTAEIKGAKSVIDRYEWIIYKELSNYLKQENIRIPTFGDYTISHPRVVSLDMRFVKPSAKLIYAIDDAFYVRKGPNVRDNGFAQYHDYCSELLKNSIFQGEAFSAGDKLIFDCAHKTVKPGNLTTWKWVGTNHHMERLVEDISSFSSFLNTP
jgi:hypothetical protein